MNYDDSIRALYKLRKDFLSYLDHLGLDKFSPICPVLMSNDQFIKIDRKDISVLQAWISWVSIFNNHSSIGWVYKDRNQRDDLTAIEEFINSFGDCTKTQKINTFCIKEVFNESRICAIQYSPGFGRGLSLTHLIVDSFEEHSKDWQDIINELSPTRPHSKRFITVEA